MEYRHADKIQSRLERAMSDRDHAARILESMIANVVDGRGYQPGITKTEVKASLHRWVKRVIELELNVSRLRRAHVELSRQAARKFRPIQTTPRQTV